MANIFKEMINAVVPSNKFDLSHDVKFTCDMGELVPFCVIPTIPGDVFSFRTEALTRFFPLLAAAMHDVDICIDWYEMPNRIAWDNWEKWIVGNDASVLPYFEIGANLDIGDVGDYMGLPVDTAVSPSPQVQAFPIAMYAWVYDHYYRDQNIQTTEKYQGLNAGVNNWARDIANAAPFKVAWSHDYFTACLPTAQQGATVELPLVQSSTINVTTNTGTAGTLRNASTDAIMPSITQTGTDGSAQFTGDATPAYYDPAGSLKVDVQGDATDLITVRRAFRLQEWLEKNIRGGQRYVEHLLSHFGVNAMTRVDIPQFIGSTKSKMVISEVLSTADSGQTGSTVLGEMGGHGISVNGSKTMKYYCREHGHIMGLFYVRPRAAYSQGIPKWWQTADELDFPWPAFAHIGEQEVKNKEVYLNHTTPDGTFGYIPRYAEYKFVSSRTAGKLRTGSTLDYWHLGRQFSSDPNLNSTFIECNPAKRIFVDQSEDSIIAHIIVTMWVSRKLPKFGIPKL